MKLYKRQFRSMGCMCNLYIYACDDEAAENVFNAVFAEADRLDRYYTNYSPKSFTAAINRSAGDKKGILVDPETAILLDYAQQCVHASDGLFDITAGALHRVWNFDVKNQKLPSSEAIKNILKIVGWEKISWHNPRLILPEKGMMIDFGGVVKEYAADAAAKICYSMNIKHGLIDMSGDIKIIGAHVDGRPWSIGVRHPKHPEKEIAHIQLTEGALATSGDYEKSIEIKGKRYTHILNPRTGFPVEGISSVTAVTDHCLVAGSLTTIAFLKGPLEGVKWLESTHLPYFCVNDKGDLVGSKEFDSSLTI